METLSPETQYNDMRGDSAADYSDHNNIREFGFPGFPVGISFYSADDGNSQRVAVYTVDCGSFDDVEEMATQNDGILQAKQHDLEKVTVTDLLRYFKRFNVTLQPRFKNVKRIEYDT